MNKYYLLAGINILLIIFFGYLVLPPGSLSDQPPLSIGSIFHYYLPASLIISLIILNIYSAYSLLKKNQKQPDFTLYLILTSHTVFWFLLMSAAYFYAAEITFPVALMLIIGVIFFLIKRYSTQLAVKLTLVTILILLLNIIFSFEEAYCWDKGTEADPTGSKMVVATEEDMQVSLMGNIVPGQTQIGVASQAHFKCHQNFDFYQALQEKYFLR